MTEEQEAVEIVGKSKHIKFSAIACNKNFVHSTLKANLKYNFALLHEKEYKI